MARIVDPNSEVDPTIAASLAGPPRSQRSTREGTERLVPKKRRDKFHVDPSMIPKGYVVEWKRKSCLNKPEEADYFMELADAGWKNAPMEHFKRLMPEDYEGKIIERGGMILMMRPKHMKDADLKLQRMEANNQVRDKLVEIGMTGQGELPRKVTSFERKFDRQAVPDDEGE